MNTDRYKNYLTENTKPFLNISGLTVALSLSLLLFSSMVLSAPFDYVDTTTQTVDEVVAGCPGGVSTVYNVTDNFTINDLNVGVIIEHTWRGDLEVFVQSPALTTATLIADNGGGVDNLNVLFDSDSATAIANVDHGLIAIYENQIFPPSATTALDVFDGENSVGSWVITVCDDAASDVGEWTRSSLEFDGTLVPSELTVVKSIPVNADGDGNGYISVGDVLTYTITATNTGTIALTNVAVNDPLIAPNSNTCPNVAVAGTCVLVGTYTVLAVDRLVGNILNTATADSDQTVITNSNTVHTVVGSDPVAEAESVFYMPLPEDDALTALL
ncbi:MAG: proprotein convertase P-domain-containing protein, partial [Proteobacteria bacterium]|nr:proprotein convertase P-domain-containing protein [Pseudomonadota bacterium]